MRTKVVGAVPEMHRAALPAVAARRAGRVAVLKADPAILYVYGCDIEASRFRGARGIF